MVARRRVRAQRRDAQEVPAGARSRRAGPSATTTTPATASSPARRSARSSTPSSCARRGGCRRRSRPASSTPNVLMIEKSLPHGIFVNRDAKRFLNEGENYNDLVIKMYEQDAKDHASIPAWFIVDATYRKRYNLGPVLPAFAMSDKKLPPGLAARARAGCTRPTRSRSSRPTSTSTPPRCARPSTGSTASPAPASTRTSTAAPAPTTATTPTRARSRTPRWARSRRRRSTRSR